VLVSITASELITVTSTGTTFTRSHDADIADPYLLDRHWNP
jgi:hypothetical protein